MGSERSGSSSKSWRFPRPPSWGSWRNVSIRWLSNWQDQTQAARQHATEQEHVPGLPPGRSHGDRFRDLGFAKLNKAATHLIDARSRESRRPVGLRVSPQSDPATIHFDLAFRIRVRPGRDGAWQPLNRGTCGSREMSYWTPTDARSECVLVLSDTTRLRALGKGRKWISGECGPRAQDAPHSHQGLR